jgi:hypothetical protein
LRASICRFTAAIRCRPCARAAKRSARAIVSSISRSSTSMSAESVRARSSGSRAIQRRKVDARGMCVRRAIAVSDRPFMIPPMTRRITALRERRCRSTGGSGTRCGRIVMFPISFDRR